MEKLIKTCKECGADKPERPYMDYCIPCSDKMRCVICNKEHINKKYLDTNGDVCDSCVESPPQ